jgi:catechol 2,3-dioxygenase-like lactoylglutathione lyase family enzyme
MIQILEMHHVQITVPKASESACKHFYGSVLALEEIPKPAQLLKNGGAWYKVGNSELHVSIEDEAFCNSGSKRHVCYIVPDLRAIERYLRSQGIEIVPDRQEIEGWRRIYVRDPGGNRIEIAERM